MLDSPFSWVYRDPFHAIYMCTTTGVSLFSNCLLLFIIYTTHATQLGTYRYLLAIFATCDITTSLMHVVLQPICHLTSSGFYAMPRFAEPMSLFGASADVHFIMMFIVTFYQTFLILAYHFVYRYRAVSRWKRKSSSDWWPTKLWALISCTVYVLYIGTFVSICMVGFTPTEWTRANAPPGILELYGKDLCNHNNGFICIYTKRPCSDSSDDLCWHWPSVAALLGVGVLFLGTAAVIVYCITQTNAAFRSTNSSVSAKTKEMQRDVFKALLIQVWPRAVQNVLRHLLFPCSLDVRRRESMSNEETAVPCFFSYIPLTVIIGFPIVSGISLGDFANLLLSITAIFPAIDSLFVLYFIAKFRTAVIRLFHLPCFGAGQEVSSVADLAPSTRSNWTEQQPPTRGTLH